MAERDFVELRSDDVQEILGTPPHWLVRWGTAVTLIGFVLMLTAAWFVRYPDVINARIIITTKIPPVDLVARTEGRISKLVVKDIASVKKGQVLAVMQSTADYEDVLKLDAASKIWQRAPVDSLKVVRSIPGLDLGELQAEYATFLQQLERFQFGSTNRSASARSNIGSINQQIKQLEQSISFDQKALKRTKNQLEIAEELLQNQQKLFDQGVIARVELEKEKTKVSDIERQYEEQEDNVLQKQNTIINLRRGINDVSLGASETYSSTTTSLLNSLSALRSAIDKWKQTYLLIAPIEGKVSLNADFVKEQQYMKQGELVLTILPPQNQEIIGRVSLPITGSGKVTENQEVVVKLDNYPYHEFGSIKGLVLKKSLVPKDDAYTILVGFKETLITSHKKEIPFSQQLQGRAEIITDNKNFLQRLAEQLFVKH
jgi:multidrug efflux pump subunit AcrA (membrane-fusion protein)